MNSKEGSLAMEPDGGSVLNVPPNPFASPREDFPWKRINNFYYLLKSMIII
jgi:hypothetical protein